MIHTPLDPLFLCRLVIPHLTSNPLGCNLLSQFYYISPYNIVVDSTNALLTNATKPDVNDVMSQAWFHVATSISHFSGFKCDGKCWHQKAGIFHLILSQKWGCSVFLPKFIFYKIRFRLDPGDLDPTGEFRLLPRML